MYGTYDASTGPRLTAALFNAVGAGLATWYLLGQSAIVETLGIHPAVADPLRRGVLVAMSLTYLARFLLTMFVILKRTVPWGESFTVGLWVVVIHTSMAFLGGSQPAPAGVALGAGALLYVVGSFLNTGSEYQRKLWKKRPENHGRLYTEGLFRYAMHINYFGDVVLFTGFALVTGSPWAFIVPGLMLCLFAFGNIPMLDRYLAERYGTAFEAYRQRTHKLIPFLY